MIFQNLFLFINDPFSHCVPAVVKILQLGFDILGRFFVMIRFLNEIFSQLTKLLQSLLLFFEFLLSGLLAIDTGYYLGCTFLRWKTNYFQFTKGWFSKSNKVCLLVSEFNNVLSLYFVHLLLFHCVIFTSLHFTSLVPGAKLAHRASFFYCVILNSRYSCPGFRTIKDILCHMDLSIQISNK